MTDPMQPPNVRGLKATPGKKTDSPWQLTSTLIAKDRRLATVNGKTITIGEKINGAEIIDIQPAKVTLRYENRSIILKLLPSMVKHQRRISME